MAAPTAAPPPELTIEQLAQATQMTVRNIRNHQSRGVLPPPTVRARVGYYGPDHVARLKLIQEMQADGFNLEAIKRLLTGADGVAEQGLGFKRAIGVPFETESPEILTLEELVEFVGPVDDPAVLETAVRLEIIVPLDDGRVEVPSPLLLRAAQRLIRRGVPLSALLETLATTHEHCDAIASTFARLYRDQVWKPFEAAGRPEDRWPDLVESIEELRPLASEAVLSVFHQTMSAAVERQFGAVFSDEE